MEENTSMIVSISLLHSPTSYNGSSASAIWMRFVYLNWNQDDIFGGKHPLQGVEVNGLFNPIER
jgi:hypothetical protein